MGKRILSRVLLGISLLVTFAQRTFAEPPFTVAAFDEWGDGGLTITSTFNGHYYTSPQVAPALKIYDVIRFVNGQSVKGLTPEAFYTFLQGPELVVLDVERKQAGQNLSFQTYCQPIAGLDRIEKLSMKGGEEMAREVLAAGRLAGEIHHTAATCDLFAKQSFDLNIDPEQLGEDAPIAELLVKKLTALGFVRDRVAPDLVLSILSDRNQRVEASYRPLMRGEKPDSEGRWFGSRYRDMLRENPYLLQMLDEKKEGYYLELTVLDGALLRSGVDKAPILWQYHYEEAQKPAWERLQQILYSTMEFPMAGHIFAEWPDLFTGLEFVKEFSENRKKLTYRVAMVVDGSRAAKMGFQKGDILWAFMNDTAAQTFGRVKTTLLSEEIPITKRFMETKLNSNFTEKFFYFVLKHNGKYLLQDFADEYARHLLTTSGRFNYRKILYERSLASEYKSLNSGITYTSFSTNFHEPGYFEVKREREKVQLRGELFPTYYRLSLKSSQMVQGLISR